jgi:Putative addiction module component
LHPVAAHRALPLSNAGKTRVGFVELDTSRGWPGRCDIQLDLGLVGGKIIGMEISSLPIDRMTVKEKLLAMEALWDNLCRDEPQVPVQEWHTQLLDERRRQIEAGEMKFVDWDTAKARIRSRIQ